MAKKHNPGCSCCGALWEPLFDTAQQPPIPPQTIYDVPGMMTAHEFTSREPLYPSRSFPNFYRPSAGVLTYSQLANVGPDPRHVGYTTAGEVILRDKDGDWWLSNPSGTEVVEFWPRSSYVARNFGAVQSGSIMYCGHQDWEVGFVPTRLDADGSQLTRFVCDQDGELVREVPSGWGQPQCIDNHGNVYTLKAGFSKTELFKNGVKFAEYFGPELRPGVYSHDGSRLLRFSGEAVEEVNESTGQQNVVGELPEISVANIIETVAGYPTGNQFSPERGRHYVPMQLAMSTIKSIGTISKEFNVFRNIRPASSTGFGSYPPVEFK